MGKKATNFKYISQITKDMHQKVNASYDTITALEKTVKTCLTGNSGKSYWNGRKALVTSAANIRRVANAYARLYGVASAYEKMCEEYKANATEDKSTGWAITFHDRAQAYSSIMKKCEQSRSNLLKWAKS